MTQQGKFVALGFFDGLHRAHRAVLEAAVSGGGALGLRPAVLLFDQHPLGCITGQAPPLLLEDGERDAILANLGLDPQKYAFEALRDLPPETFFGDILLGQLNAGGLCCGDDYRFGRAASGDVALLRRLCAAGGVALEVIPEMDYAGERISSTRIRAALARGEVEDANAMLGRPFGYSFPVVGGDRIGRTLGAPTINQLFPPGFAVPRYGVYAAQAYVDGRWRPGVTNIGRRPSFESSALRSETHILGYEGDLYGQRAPVALLRFLRPERSFGSMEELKEQIARDKINAEC